MNSVSVAVIQMVSSNNVVQNMEDVYRLLETAAKNGARWAVLPEYWSIMGLLDTDKVQLQETFGDGMLQDFLSRCAKEFQLTLFGGSLPLKSDDPNKVYNSLLVYDSDGICISRYDKQHLFGYTDLGESFNEANTIQKGKSVSKLTIDGLDIAQGICYDLRFPEFFRQQLPFDVLVLPAAFTYTTGLVHWEILLRARAIENQCYVLAAAQGGMHNNGRHSYGHSMIIDSWGKVLARAEEGQTVIFADLNLQQLVSVRRKLPALKDI